MKPVRGRRYIRKSWEKWSSKKGEEKNRYQ
jgi:hypothetical protein